MHCIKDSFDVPAGIVGMTAVSTVYRVLIRMILRIGAKTSSYRLVSRYPVTEMRNPKLTLYGCHERTLGAVLNCGPSLGIAVKYHPIH